MPLDLPDLRDPTGYQCGPVAAAVVLRFHGRPVPRSFPSCSPVDGTDPLALVPVFRRAGLHVLAGEMSADDLRFQLRQGRPVVCLHRLGDTGHYSVVRGVERQTVLLQCPARGPVSERLSEWVGGWWDAGRDCRYHQWGISVWAE